MRPNLPRGMRDFLPAEMSRRQSVFRMIEHVFTRYGFQALSTPSLEKSEVLLGKYGEDAQPMIYHARHDAGKEVLSLRYDLTVPLARVVAMHDNQLALPFKRYQIAPVWRAERPQRGRYREFYQCDADIVGSASIAADAELIVMLVEILTTLGFGTQGPKFCVHINNRKLLHGIGEFAGVPIEQLTDLYRSVDKYERLGITGVEAELAARGISVKAIERLLTLLTREVEDEEPLDSLRSILAGISSATTGIKELLDLANLLESYAVPKHFYCFDFTMVRGLGYYTGPIYEAIIQEPNLGSISGGGRYDNLIGIFRRKSLPTTGLSIGVERILDLMMQLEMTLSEEDTPHPADIYVTVFGEKERNAAISFAQELRAIGLRVELSYEISRLGQQFRIADRKGIPLVVIIAPDELKEGVIRSKRLSDGEENTWLRSTAAGDLRAYIHDETGERGEQKPTQ